MKLSPQSAHKSVFNQTRHSLIKRNGAALLFLFGLMTVAAVKAAAETTTPPTDPSLSIANPSGTYSSPAMPIAPVTTPSTSPFAVGEHIPLLITGTVAEVYDDNIYLQPHKSSDFITQLSLVLDYRVGNDTAIDGNYLDLFYAPSGDIYANHSSSNSFNQNTGAFFQHRFSKLTLGITQTYTHESVTAAQLNNLVTSAVLFTKVSAKYVYDEKISIDSSFNQRYTDYETSGYSNSNEWYGEAYALYKYDAKLTVGAGPRFGWLDVGMAPNQTYQQYLGRVDYQYSGKLLFELYAGVEDRQYQGSVTGDKIAPVFAASATYTPFINTALTLAAHRSYSPSYDLNGQNFIATAVSLIGRQRFCDEFYYNLGFGYENDTYEGAGVTLTGPSRNDNYYYVTTGFDWVPNSWYKGSIYYKYQRDDSNFSSFAFTDNQVGVSASFAY